MKIVLLPGLGGTGGLFQPLINALPASLEPVVVPYPPDRKLDYNELETLIRSRLPDSDYLLLGESFSGYLAYRLAVSRPSHLRAVVFVAAFLTPPHSSLLRLSRRLPRTALLSLPAPDLVLDRLLLGGKGNQSVLTLMRQAIARISPAVLSFRLGEIERLEYPLDHCLVPAVYLQASNDKLVPRHCVAPFHSVCPALEVVPVEGPHFLLQTRPVECAAIIKQLAERMSSIEPDAGRD